MTIDWTAAADLALQRVEGMTDEVGGDYLGTSPSTLRRWRALRAKGEPVPDPRGDSRRALQRAWEGSSQMPPQGAIAGSYDPFLEAMVREARAAESRARAAESWARWLEKEADGRAAVQRWADANGRGPTPVMPRLAPTAEELRKKKKAGEPPD